MFGSADDFAVNFSRQHILDQCHPRSYVYDLERTVRQPGSSSITNPQVGRSHSLCSLVAEYLPLVELQDTTYSESSSNQVEASNRVSQSSAESRQYRYREQQPVHLRRIVGGCSCIPFALEIARRARRLRACHSLLIQARFLRTSGKGIDWGHASQSVTG